MNYQNKQLISRLIFMVIFGLLVFGVFLTGRILSKSQNGAFGDFIDASFTPSEKGQLVLVEFSDFQCPACRLYYPLVRQLKSEFGDNLTFIYKHFPLKNIHKNAELAGRASEAALNQGKFWEMHDLIFEKQAEWSGSGQALSLFTAYAVSLGLDQNKFLIDIDSDLAKNKVEKDYRQGVNLKINGTPTFFLNGKKITNPRNYGEFKQLMGITL